MENYRIGELSDWRTIRLENYQSIRTRITTRRTIYNLETLLIDKKAFNESAADGRERDARTKEERYQDLYFYGCESYWNVVTRRLATKTTLDHFQGYSIQLKWLLHSRNEFTMLRLSF